MFAPAVKIVSAIIGGAALILGAAWWQGMFHRSSVEEVRDNPIPINHPLLLDGNRMLSNVETLLGFGPRTHASAGHAKAQAFIAERMDAAGLGVVTQQWVHERKSQDAMPMVNVIGRYAPENPRRIILGTHYDSKMLADLDTENPSAPVPGANDSASGVAVLLAIAEALAQASTSPMIGIDFVFFDGEEGEPEQGSDYASWIPLGSTYFAQNVRDLYPDVLPAEAIVLDMVCDADLKLLPEQFSSRYAPESVSQFWDIGHGVNASVFENAAGPAIFDDHMPLNQIGIPSFLVIDYTYPYFHTTKDTLERCSPMSLETVGEATAAYIYTRN